MLDPTTPTPLDDRPAWSDTDAAELAFARRAATYLGRQGLEPDAIAIALRAELGLSEADAVALSGNHHGSAPPPWGMRSPRRGCGPATPSTLNPELISH